MMIKWSPLFATNIELVDEQHQKLFSLVNELAAIIKQGVQNVESLDQAFEALCEYANKHFSDEEEIMIREGVDERHLATQKMEHQSFIYDARRIRSEMILDMDPHDQFSDLVQFVASWLIYHTLRTDQHMAMQVAAIRGGMSADEAYDKFNSAELNPKINQQVLTAVVKLWTDAADRANALDTKLQLKTYDQKTAMPDENGYFGKYGGQVVAPEIAEMLNEINQAYDRVSKTASFQQELQQLYADYVGRPSPIYYARRLSEKQGGARIFLKREDLNHTGAHKINHCLGEALLAKHMGKKKLIAETGSGQHGVALATACALLDLECEIHMGEIDFEKERLNVTRMKVLGCRVVPVRTGAKSLQDAVDSAFAAYLEDPYNLFYAIGSVVGPHPYPRIVRDFQRIVGKEAREQFLAKQYKLPDVLVASVGGGSDAIGLFEAFLDDTAVEMIGVEAAGKGLDSGQHAATLTRGAPGTVHGSECYTLQDEEGKPLPAYSIASGLGYPGVGPQHCYLKDIQRVRYETIDDEECLDAFMQLSRLEGIVPALESAHAVAYAMKIAPKMNKDEAILVNLSGRGDKDVDFVAKRLGL